jgi:DNA-binding transcriptional ArsR family regulator
MEISTALDALSALSHETRLWVFRLLVQAGPDGLPAGDIADALGSRQNTMSSHLRQLQASGLVSGERCGRQILYRVNFDTVRDLVMFLVEDCCAGSSQLCDPLVETLATCCAVSTSNALSSRTNP